MGALVISAGSEDGDGPDGGDDGDAQPDENAPCRHCVTSRCVYGLPARRSTPAGVTVSLRRVVSHAKNVAIFAAQQTSSGLGRSARMAPAWLTMAADS
jgi:hypothetical protein